MYSERNNFNNKIDTDLKLFTELFKSYIMESELPEFKKMLNSAYSNYKELLEETNVQPISSVISLRKKKKLEEITENEVTAIIYDSFRKVTKGWSETDSRTYLGSFMFTGDEIEKLVKVLSGGEKARLALARMLVVPSHLILLDEPTNHLDMVSRKILGKSLSLFKGSIVCISHDRHFLNEVTNMTCEVGNGTVITFNGNYDYYEWKNKNKDKISLKVTNQKKNKNNYKDAKKIRNRINWIEKRFFKIEESINELQIIINNPKNTSNHELLKNNLNEVNELENEYFSLMEEKELINKERQ